MNKKLSEYLKENFGVKINSSEVEDFGIFPASHFERIYRMRLNHLHSLGKSMPGMEKTVIALAGLNNTPIKMIQLVGNDSVWIFFIEVVLDKIISAFQLFDTFSTIKEYYFFHGFQHPFSQWHPCNFTLDAINYNCTEQYMMHQKAVLFNDLDSALAILNSKSPKDQKLLGRGVRNFDDTIWGLSSQLIVYKGNYAKFGQNQDLKLKLLGTGNKILAEASPSDIKWGIGLSADHPGRFNPKNWRGQNLLGKILMEVRSSLQCPI